MADDGALGVIKDFLMDVLAVLGLGLGGGQAAAAAELLMLQQESMRENLPTRLAPAQAAAAVVKGHITQGDGAVEASYAGVDAETFAKMVETTGNPPGPETLLELHRRRIIGMDQVADGMRQGYLKNDWIGYYQTLTEALLPTAEVVAAVVQNQLDYAAGADMAGKNGYDGNLFDVMVRTHGNPPGPTQLLEMWRRGIISQDEVEQGLRESRLKNKWIPSFLQLNRRRIPMRTITTLLNHGAISDETAHSYLAELGYSDEDATALIQSSKYVKAKADHDLSVAQIRALYTERIMSQPDAVAALTQAGYNAQTATQILALADVQADHKVRTQAITNVRGRFVGRRIDATEATTALDGLGVPSDQRDHLLTVWTYEREANTANLTVAQWAQAVKRGAVDLQRWSEEMTRYGYPDDLVPILAIVEGLVSPPRAGV